MPSSVVLAGLGLVVLLLQAAARTDSVPVYIIGGCALGAGLVGIATKRGSRGD